MWHNWHCENSEVWKDVLSIVIQTCYAILKKTSVCVFHVLRLRGWWQCACMRMWVAVCFQCFVGSPLSPLYPSTLCQTPLWLPSLQYPPCSAQMSPHTHIQPDTPHTLHPPPRRTTFTAIHQFQPPWWCDICVNLCSVPLYVCTICALWCDASR